MVFAAKSKPRATRRPRPAEFADARLEFETAEERFLRRLQGVGKREEKRR